MLKIRKEKLPEGKIIPMCYDFVFANIFNNENNIKLVEYFLRDYLNESYEEIKGNVKINKTELPLNNKKDQRTIVDVLLTLRGEKINIEMSNHFPKGNIERNIVYAGRIHGTQLKYIDKDYTKIRKTLQINLNNFTCNKNNLIESYYLRNEEGKLLTKEFQIDIVDMEKSKKICYDNNKIAKWLRLFKEAEKEEFMNKVRELEMDKDTEENLIDDMKRISSDEECIGLYTKLSHHEMLINTEIREAEIKAAAKAEKQKSIEIAKNLLKMGLTTEQIVESTKLPLNEVLELTKENN